MSVFKTKTLEELLGFPKQQDQLAIVTRKQPEEAGIFFEKLLRTPIKIIGQVSQKNSLDDIIHLLEESIPAELQADPFYARWVSDMVQVCETFCHTLSSEAVGFCLETSRGCRRYHVDNVPMRLLVTYHGKGTEWLPDEAADRRALAEGAPNEKIIKDPSACQFMNTWDVAIFRGGPKGLLHRTPDAALDGSSVLMRLDHGSYWDNILKQQQSNILTQVTNA